MIKTEAKTISDYCQLLFLTLKLRLLISHLSLFTANPSLITVHSSLLIKLLTSLRTAHFPLFITPHLALFTDYYSQLTPTSHSSFLNPLNPHCSLPTLHCSHLTPNCSLLSSYVYKVNMEQGFQLAVL